MSRNTIILSNDTSRSIDTNTGIVVDKLLEHQCSILFIYMNAM